jgi:hypothetical protein
MRKAHGWDGLHERHMLFGTVCYWSVCIVCVTMAAATAVMRWPQDVHPLIIGSLANGSESLA